MAIGIFGFLSEMSGGGMDSLPLIVGGVTLTIFLFLFVRYCVRGMPATLIKWKLGFGKKDHAFRYYYLNGNSRFFGAPLDDQNSVEVITSKGERKKVFVKLEKMSRDIYMGRPFWTLVEGKAGNINVIDIINEVKPTLEDKELNALNTTYLDLGYHLAKDQLEMKGLKNLEFWLIVIIGILCLVSVWFQFSNMAMLEKAMLVFKQGTTIIYQSGVGGSEIVPVG